MNRRDGDVKGIRGRPVRQRHPAYERHGQFRQQPIRPVLTANDANVTRHPQRRLNEAMRDRFGGVS